MSIQVTTIEDTPRLLALRVSGTGEERLLRTLVDGIHAVGHDKECVVLDLDDLVLISAAAVRAFVHGLTERLGFERVVIACNRLSCRQVLRRWGGSGVVITDDLDLALGRHCGAAVPA